jgi:2-polyprenyl-6-methoxyphenol hydroxylase-like FAD-dependent oxidoreductase
MTTSEVLDMPPQSPIAILGTGIGGLALARCLKAKGIPAVIYERVSSAALAKRHTYGIILEGSECAPLAGLLDATSPPSQGGPAARMFQKPLAVDFGIRKVPVGKVFASAGQDMFRVDRNKFENMLLEGLRVETEREAVSATVSDGSDPPEVELANGEKVQHSFIVDCTGVHSKVRQSLLPHVQLDVLPFAAYSGKRYIDRKHFDELFLPVFEDGNMISWQPRRAGNPRLEVSINGFWPHKDKVSISYVYSRPSTGELDGLARPARSNSMASDIPEELFVELQDLLQKEKDLPSVYREVFDPDKVRADRVLHWLMRTHLIPEDDLLRLAKGGLVLLGDAAHSTPILSSRTGGANLAIRDATALVRSIEWHGAERNALVQFVAENFEGWREHVKKCRENIAKMHAPAKASL